MSSRFKHFRCRYHDCDVSHDPVCFYTFHPDQRRAHPKFQHQGRLPDSFIHQYLQQKRHTQRGIRRTRKETLPRPTNMESLKIWSQFYRTRNAGACRRLLTLAVRVSTEANTWTSFNTSMFIVETTYILHGHLSLFYIFSISLSNIIWPAENLNLKMRETALPIIF